MTRLAKFTIALLLSAPLVAPGAARAQFPFSPFLTTRDPATAVKFNLFPPGARSLAMGGAFLGLADDATAAYTNPAGLTNLTLGGPEVALEVRQTQFTGTFVSRGHYPTIRDIVADPPQLTLIGEDSVSGLPLSETESEVTGLSFLSFGYVLPGGLTMAIYRHELANFRSAFDSQGPFNDDFCASSQGPCALYRVQPLRSSIDLEIVNYGASAAYAFDLPPLKGLESNLSVGLGVSYFESKAERVQEVFDLCRVVGSCSLDDTADRLPGGFFGPADFSRDNFFEGITEKGDDEAFGFNLGFLWKLGRQQRWSLGGVFRKGPDFVTQRESEFVDLSRIPETLETLIVPEAPGSVTVPDVLGLGLAYRADSGSTKITLDVNQVSYSQTLADFNTSFCIEISETSPFGCVSSFSPSDFEISDATQVHLGLERTILVVESLFVGTARFGAWYEPFHEPEYIGQGPDLIALLRRPTDDEIHFSAGLGLVIKEDYQIDIAADFSDPITTVSISLVKFL